MERPRRHAEARLADGPAAVASDFAPAFMAHGREEDLPVTPHLVGRDVVCRDTVTVVPNADPGNAVARPQWLGHVPRKPPEFRLLHEDPVHLDHVPVPSIPHLVPVLTAIEVDPVGDGCRLGYGMLLSCRERGIHAA